MIDLRDYQLDLINGLRLALGRVRRVLAQLPTGGGKTVVAAFMAGNASARGVRVWFVCHRAELVTQTSKTFRAMGLQHGIVAAGHPMTPGARIQVCSIDTLKNRAHLLEAPGLVIWDECHHIAAAGWAGLMAKLVAARHVGLTATPWRLNGDGLQDYFDDIVLGPQVAELIARGALSPFTVFAPPPPDALRKVKKVAGDFAAGAAAEVMGNAKLIGDIVGHWQRRATGLRTVGFACRIDHSEAMVAAFRERGIPAAHLDGNTPAAERARIIRDYADGALQVLWNVSLFGEGFDLAAIADRPVTIDAVIQARPTQSLSLHLQQCGRALRPAEGKVAIILDHAGNAYRHGLPDDDRDWTLEGRPKAKKSANDNAPPLPETCPGCYNQVRKPLPPVCPHCGHRFLRAAAEIKHADGELVEIGAVERAAIRRLQLREQAEAKSLQDLVALGARRGYRAPQAWAMKVWGSRQAKGRRAG